MKRGYTQSVKKQYEFCGEGRGVPGLPHVIDDLARWGVSEQRMALLVEAGLYRAVGVAEEEPAIEEETPAGSPPEEMPVIEPDENMIEEDMSDD
jgi:hypothetical protein